MLLSLRRFHGVTRLVWGTIVDIGSPDILRNGSDILGTVLLDVL